jgi:calcineurin-like phosphoesterase family protein
MTHNTFFVSDTHFGHENTCTLFKRADGSPLRPFANAQEMDEEMVARWNAVVKPQDKVYHLGDVVINRKHLPTLARLNGHKRLIRGNHDIFPTKEYLKYFDEIYGVRVLPDMILSHIPLDRESITQRFRVNVHGHLHANKLDSPYHYCVCVEHTDFAPIEYTVLQARVKAHRESYGVFDNENPRTVGPA